MCRRGETRNNLGNDAADDDAGGTGCCKTQHHDVGDDEEVWTVDRSVKETEAAAWGKGAVARK